MTEEGYIELHARNAFNFRRGAVQPEALAEAMALREVPAFASLDRDGLYGAPAVHFAAKEQGLRAIIGAELTMEDDTVLPVLCENRCGYQGLCSLLSEAHLRASKGQARIGWAELAERSEGLLALTGDAEGPLRQGWKHDGANGMARGLERLQRTFGPDRLWVEVQRHGLKGERHWNRALVDLAASAGLPLLATQGPAYVEAEGRRVLDFFTCVRHHTTMAQAGRLLEANACRTPKGASAMRQLFSDLPQACAQTLRLAERASFELEDLGYAFPRYPLPQGETQDARLRQLVYAGAQGRYGDLSQEVRRQLEHELAIISKLGFSGYFLIVWDICEYCRQQGILAQGRGSAANSAVCYCLGITAVDPIKQRLLFERFLSEGRQSWPDIDIDLPSGNQREQVIQEVYQRYGKHGAAMTANVITYRGRSAMREVGKVLGLPLDVVERFNALAYRGDYPNTLAQESQLKQAGLEVHHPAHRAAVDLYERLLGLPRHLGQHSGGMIVCQGSLSRVVPLENASMPGRVVCQWDKEACENIGIIKIDLLGLGMMAVLQEAIELAAQQGRPITLAEIPKDDSATFDLLCRAETMGVFQVESRAQMATLPRMQPRTFYDLAIEVAIIRPGPIAGHLTNPYLDRRNGLVPVTYLDERLKPILERTLGVALFQEQVLQIAMVMADYAPHESEELRRALGFSRNTTRQSRAKATLRTKLEQRQIDPSKIEELVNLISSFALYGFPESHAISFALLAYASSYLKVHRQEAFYCTLLNNQPMGFYAPATLIQEARRYGLTFEPPCLATSSWATTIVGEKRLRLGLKLVQGLGEAVTQEALTARAEGPFVSLIDLRLRTEFSTAQLRALAKAGALRQWCPERRRALWEIERPLFKDDLFAREPPAEFAVSLEEMTEWERLCADFSATRVTTEAHPMQYLQARLSEKITLAADLPALANGKRATVAGAVICRQRPGTAKGVVFVSLEDHTGIANCVLWPNIFERNRLTVTTEPFLLIKGHVQQSQGTTHLVATQCQALKCEDAPTAASHDFH